MVRLNLQDYDLGDDEIDVDIDVDDDVSTGALYVLIRLN